MLENMTLKELKEKIMNDDIDWNKISKDEITNVLKFEMKNITNVNRIQNWISALNAIKKKKHKQKSIKTRLISHVPYFVMEERIMAKQNNAQTKSKLTTT